MLRIKRNRGINKLIRSSYLSLVIFFIHITFYGQISYVVDTADDLEDVDLADSICADQNGNCPLRAAIQNANKTSVVDRIYFNIPGNGPFNINLKTNLPKIIETIVLDATTQPGYLMNFPQIVINGKEVPYVPEPAFEDVVPVGFNLIGNSSGSTIKGFVIGNFGYTNNAEKREDMIYYRGIGIYLGTDHNVVQSNFIGLSADGKSPFSNIYGIATNIRALNNLVGGVRPEERNIISGNSRVGILAYTKTQVIGNFIGTTPDGITGLGNPNGVVITAPASKNFIASNLISGNRTGINCNGDENVFILNYIGTDHTGTAAIPNEVGIRIMGGLKNKVGLEDAGNLISGNDFGILIMDIVKETPASQFNQITANFIGTDCSGSYSLSNNKGINVINGGENLIGGSTSGESNLISGNLTVGIELKDTKGNRVENNILGTDVLGMEAIPNGTGIIITNPSERSDQGDNMIKENLISGNLQDGIQIINSEFNSVVKNRIGTTREGTAPLANGGNGLKIIGKEKNNCIGGLDPVEENVIAFNKENGIVIFPALDPEMYSSKQKIFYNRIFSNQNSDISVMEKKEVQIKVK